MLKKSISAIVLAFAFILGGCTPLASSGLEMTVRPQEFGGAKATSPLKDNVDIEQVSGGEETNPLWTSEIGGTEFRQALEQSLIAAELYSGRGRFRLSATILAVDQPLVGFDITVTTKIRYELFDIQTEQSVFAETITVPFTATVGDAFAGFERLKIANERSARGNITQLIRRLLSLDISEVSLSH